MEKSMINRLIEDVIAQAKTGTVKVATEIDFWTFAAKFFVRFENESVENIDYPIINVGNKKNFLEAVGKYIKIAKEFYINDKNYYDLTDTGFIKKLFLDLFYSMNNFDLNNFYTYLEDRTQMLKNDLTEYNNKYGIYKNYNISISIDKNCSNLESPYRFSLYFKKDDQSFLLPNIFFGISNNTCIIYAIQNKNKNKNSEIAKKLNRLFFKINKGCQDDFTKETSPSAIMALTLFYKKLTQMGITDVKAPNFLPIRFASNMYTGHSKQTEMSKSEFEENYYPIQNNITNKFTNTFFRIAEHFEKTKVDFDEIQEVVISKINLNTKNDHFLCNLVNNLNTENETQKIK